MMTRSTRLGASILFLFVFVSAVWLRAGDLELNRYFTDDMVIQRDKPVVIKGTAPKGTTVTVEFAGQEKSGKAEEDGFWQITLAPLKAASRGRKLTVTSSVGNLKSEIDNVVVGDVILHARQTSIDISLGRDKEGQKTASSHQKDPMFRAICIEAIPSADPLKNLAPDATTGWTVVDKDSALKMTASAFYLGRDLATASDVPVGMIDLNLGSAFANSWLSREALLETGNLYDSTEAATRVEKYEAMLEAEKKGEKFHWKDEGPPANTVHHTLFPYAGYNGTLHPLDGAGFKAVVVQLGNDYPYMRYQEILDSGNPTDRKALNEAYPLVYNIRKRGFRMEPTVVPRITSEWRKYLGDQDLPFGLIVPPGSDLNTYGQHNREMRELQRLTAEDDPHIGIILPGTEHVPFSGQPADDSLLAKRCLNWIEGAVYDKPEIPATGPLFDRFEADFNQAVIYFKEGTAEGLKASGDALDYFEAANVEGDYYPVKAKVEGETIHIESDDVTRIVRIRYNWNHRPNQELVNAAGLAAIPFRSERADYHWLVRNDEEDLPEEYFMPANEWPKSDVTLINSALGKNGYSNFSGWIGPAGFKVGPFGPNMGVGEIKQGSPADGKLLEGDIIYSANGRMLGDKAWEMMAAAITESETREGAGKLVLGVRRGGKNMDVELTLEVMGRYSSTAPYDCPKTEKIVANLEKWLAETGGDDSKGRSDFLGSDSLFLLASGNPKYLGLVRRAVYKRIKNTEIRDEIDPTEGPKAWYPAWNSLLVGEYYMATGDRNVLPYWKFQCDLLAAKQHPAGAWRHNYPGGDGYGLMPALGEAAAIGFHLANDAGLDISREAYRKVVKYFHDDQAEMGQVIYGLNISRPAPPEFEPEKMNNGRMSTHNGAVGSAAVLFNLEGDTRTAHLCSLISCHAWNNTFEGHGGNFWNNFWTPLGARVQGKKSYIEFWNNYRWYRELNRMFDGGLIQQASGATGAGPGIALVVPRKRIQIVGAPPSPFEKDAPEILKPALEAYWKKDYALAAKIVNELIASGAVRLDDMPTVEYLARTAKEIPESIEADLLRIRKLIDAGDLWAAKSFLAGVAGVLHDGDARVAALQKQLADVKPPPRARQKPKEADAQEKPRQWECLVMDNQVKDPKRIQRGGNKAPIITSQRETPNLWKLEVLEDIRVAPDGWYVPKFDDSGWLETELPISWHMYHTAILRTTFDVDDKNRFDALRLDAWVLRQQGVEIYLNGELIAKINGVGRTCDARHVLKDSALKHLKNGTNTLAISTRHNWRWGMAFMKVYNDGFDFNLDARLKEDKGK